MTAEEFVRLVIDGSPIEPMDEHNECRFCGSSWAEESYDKWLERHSKAKRPDWIRDHHDEDCLWVVANQVTL